MSQQGIARFVPVLVLFAVLLVLAAIYASGNVALYRSILLAAGMHPYWWPFLDTDTVLSAARCLHNGIDAYKVNPCDPLWRPYDYSPLFMGLAWFPVTTAWIMPVGVLLCFVFLGALLLLPLPRDKGGIALMTLACTSTIVLFGLERGNNELIIFALSALGAWGIARNRTWGYGALIMAGLLKYFPLLAMATALRETPKRLFALAAVSIVLVGSLTAVTWHSLIESLANYPELSPFNETFGAKNAAQGLARMLGMDHASRMTLQAVMTAIAALLALRLGRAPRTGEVLSQLDQKQQVFLLTGSLLMIGCFFASRNIDYRGIHLLLALPGLIALRGAGMPGWLRSAPWLVIALLWGNFLLMVTDVFPGKLDQIIGWLVRELVWWWVIVVLTALTGRLLWQTPVVGEVLGRLAGRTKNRAEP
jgi:hypothetical protein